MIIKNGKSINSVEEWGQFAGPKEEIHWKDHRSAKEAAKAWFENDESSVPVEIKQAFDNSKHFTDVNVTEVEPEALLNFDSFSGPSNMDVLVNAIDDKGKFVSGIEAKADEPFSEYVKDKFTEALEAKFKSPNSKRIKRIEQLSTALFEKRKKGAPKIGELRYQLLTGLAGTVAKTIEEKCNRAVFLIHEFNTPLTTKENRQNNQDDLTNFTQRLTNGEIKFMNTGELYGPINLPGKPLFNSTPEVYIGKVYREVEK